MIAIEFTLDYHACRRLLLDRLGEPAPSHIQLLTGPRQIGKTTLLLELAARLGESALYVAGDDPQAGLPGFWERIWSRSRQLAARQQAVLLLDEVHFIPGWAFRLKGQWDSICRDRVPLHVVATGSSALRIGSASRESLAGRFERITLTHWSASALAEVFSLSPEEAARLSVRLGSYPGACSLRRDEARWRSYIREAIIEPALTRDLLQREDVRRPALLRQLFAVSVSLPAQIVSLQKLQGQLQDPGALETIAHYLALLQDAYLIAGLPKYSAEILRSRAAPPKLVVLNNALLSAMHTSGPPDPEADPVRFGRWVENACLAFALNQGQRVTYWREEPLEVDAVLEGSWGNRAVEVKTGFFTPVELRGLFEFCRRYPQFEPWVVTAPGNEDAARQAGASAMSWIDFLHPPQRAYTIR